MNDWTKSFISKPKHKNWWTRKNEEKDKSYLKRSRKKSNWSIPTLNLMLNFFSILCGNYYIFGHYLQHDIPPNEITIPTMFQKISSHTPKTTLLLASTHKWQLFFCVYCIFFFYNICAVSTTHPCHSKPHHIHRNTPSFCVTNTMVFQLSFVSSLITPRPVTKHFESNAKEVNYDLI